MTSKLITSVLSTLIAATALSGCIRLVYPADQAKQKQCQRGSGKACTAFAETVDDENLKKAYVTLGCSLDRSASGKCVKAALAVRPTKIPAMEKRVRRARAEVVAQACRNSLHRVCDSPAFADPILTASEYVPLCEAGICSYYVESVGGASDRYGSGAARMQAEKGCVKGWENACQEVERLGGSKSATLQAERESVTKKRRAQAEARRADEELQVAAANFEQCLFGCVDEVKDCSAHADHSQCNPPYLRCQRSCQVPYEATLGSQGFCLVKSRRTGLSKGGEFVRCGQ